MSKILGGFNHMFAEFRGAISKPYCQEWLYQTLISMETWRLINVRIAAHRSWDNEKKNFQTIIRCIKEILQEDHHRRAAEAGSEVESLLSFDPPLIREL